MTGRIYKEVCYWLTRVMVISLIIDDKSYSRGKQWGGQNVYICTNKATALQDTIRQAGNEKEQVTVSWKITNCYHHWLSG